MKNILSLLFLACCSCQVFSQNSIGTNYYVDCSALTNGNGSLKNPWNNLKSVNDFIFKPGDSVLFKRGTMTFGELWPKGSGNEHAQITLDAYGDGPKPIIEAQGTENKAGIRFSNQEYWTIQNFEVTNKTSTPGLRWGIYVISDDSKTKHHIHIKNNIVHDVYASYIRTPAKGSGIPSFYSVGGIYVKVEEPGKMNDVLIEGNQVTDIVGIGISFWGESESSGGMNWDNLSPNVVIRKNSVVRTAGDGILILGTDNELFEYNFVADAGHLGKNGDVPGKPGNNGTDFVAGLWPTRHRNGTVQYNEVCYTHRFIGDGQSFDNDMYVSGSTIFQYNYSHDNEGGFFLDCCKPEDTNAGTILRYNISQNDGNSDYLRLDKGKAQVYNNVFYTTDTIRIRKSSNNVFSNNIFRGEYSDWNNNIFDCNSYAGGLTPPENDEHKITSDPKLVNPGSGDIGRETLGGYKLLTGSPCLSRGKIIQHNGEKDFWSNPVPVSTSASIGAYNGQAIAEREIGK